MSRVYIICYSNDKKTNARTLQGSCVGTIELGRRSPRGSSKALGFSHCVSKKIEVKTIGLGVSLFLSLTRTRMLKLPRLPPP